MVGCPVQREIDLGEPLIRFLHGSHSALVNCLPIPLGAVFGAVVAPRRALVFQERARVALIHGRENDGDDAGEGATAQSGDNGRVDPRDGERRNSIDNDHT